MLRFNERISRFVPAMLAVLLGAGCSEGPAESAREPCLSAENMAARDAEILALIDEYDRRLGADKVDELRRVYAKLQQSRNEVGETMSAATLGEDYFRLECDYMDALIEMLETGMERR